MDFYLNRNLPPAERDLVYERLFREMGIGNKRRKDRKERESIIHWYTKSPWFAESFEKSIILNKGLEELNAYLAAHEAEGIYTPNKYPGYQCNELAAWEGQFPNWDVPGHPDNTNAFRVEMLTQLERECDVYTVQQWAPEPTDEAVPAPAAVPVPTPKPEPKQGPEWDVDGLERLTPAQRRAILQNDRF